MSGTHDREVARYWTGLSVFARLSEDGTELSSAEVGALLGTRSVKGIGAALSGTRDTLFAAGIRMDEAAIHRTVRGRSVWTGGPRIRQAMHVLEQERYRWTDSDDRDDVPIEDARPGPVLVLRALKSRGNVYRIDGGMAELDEILEDNRFEIGDARHESIGEIFVAGIEPGRDGREHSVPDGYGENGIWVRGEHDFAEPRVAGAIGAGIGSTMIAWVGEATWVERRISFVDARRQVTKVRAENSWSFSGDAIERWRDIEEDVCFRYVSWIGARGLDGPRHAPPLRMRLRCWYEVVIETAKGRRIVLREEGLRGDDARTTSKAIGRWRKVQGNGTASLKVKVTSMRSRRLKVVPPSSGREVTLTSTIAGRTGTATSAVAAPSLAPTPLVPRPFAVASKVNVVSLTGEGASNDGVAVSESLSDTVAPTGPVCVHDQVTLSPQGLVPGTASRSTRCPRCPRWTLCAGIASTAGANPSKPGLPPSVTVSTR